MAFPFYLEAALVCARFGADCLGVGAVRPAQARDEIGLFTFKGRCSVLYKLCCKNRVASGSAHVRRDPGEIERSQCSKQVAAVQGSQMKRQGEFIDDPRPQLRLQMECGSWRL